MRSWLLVVGLFGVLGMAETPGAPGPVTFEILAVGDTLAYRVGWGSGARASSYDVTITVAATNGSWSVLRDSTNCNVDPNCGHTPGNGMGVALNTPGLYRKTWLTALPWDSATFTASVVSRNSGGVSAPSVAFKRIIRPPGPPGPVTFDTASLAIVGLKMLRPAGSILPDSTLDFCALVRFGNGAMAMRAQNPCAPGLYEALPAAVRVVTPAQQARADSTCLLWSAEAGAFPPEGCVASPAMLERRGLMFRIAVR